MRAVAAAVALTRVVPLVAAALAALLLSVAAASAQDNVLALAIKATYLYKFASFVEWPPSVWQTSSSPVVLCVAGDDPFGSLLDEAVAGQRVGSHPIIVHRLPVVTRNSGCEILYVAGSPAQPVADALAVVRGTPVLTVTDSERNGGAKGIINFVILDNHVRFEIDNGAAAENGLAISSKLLSLAVHVRPRT
jgi:hypothetical protein